MKPAKITADQIQCKECGWVIPKGKTKCVNPNCPTNKPLKGDVKKLVTNA